MWKLISIAFAFQPYINYAILIKLKLWQPSAKVFYVEFASFPKNLQGASLKISVYSYLILPFPRYPIFLKISFLTSCMWVFQELFSSQHQETLTGYLFYLLLNSWQFWKVYRRVIHSKLLIKNYICSKFFIWQDFLFFKDLHFHRIICYIWQN